jgi:hypothetical protein
MSREMEDRLRAAFDAEAGRVTTATLRPAEPPHEDDRPSDGVVPIGGRRRFVAPLLAAAAVVAIAVGTTAVVRSSAHGPHTPPANTVTLSPPPEPTHALSMYGVTLQVPKTWGFGAPEPGFGGGACVTVGGVPYQQQGRLDNCQLGFFVMSASDALVGGWDPDKTDVIGNGSVCGSTSQTDATGAAARSVRAVQAADVQVGGQRADFRAFTGSCFPGTLEQWVVSTAPGVVFTRTRPDPATEAAARYAVQNAVLPGPRSPLRLSDRGYIRSLRSASDGVHIELDRVTRQADGAVSNADPATYAYTLPADVEVWWVEIHGPGSESPRLSLQQLVQLSEGHVVDGIQPPLSGLRAELVTDGSRVTRLDLYSGQ